MTFGCQVDDTVDVVFHHQRLDCLVVADVGFHEHIVLLACYVLEVRQVAGIRQLVEVDDAVFGVFVYEQAYHMRADESRSACYHDVSLEFHIVLVFILNDV